MLVWHDALSDLTDDEFRTGLARFTREATEFPTVAAVRRFSGAAGCSDTDRARLAWGQVREKIRLVGGYRTVDFEDRIINAVIREMGGWNMLCETETEAMKWRERDFLAMYETVAKSGVGDGSALPGIEATVNSKLGFSGPEADGLPARMPLHPVAAKIAREQPQRTALPAPAVKALAESVAAFAEKRERMEAAPVTEDKPERSEAELLAEADEKREVARRWLERQERGQVVEVSQ